MTMTLEFADALQSIRLKYKSSNSIAIERAVITRAEWDAIDAHLTQPAQACEHDWAVGYGVPAYCNHCGVERDPKPAQSVDVEKVREVIAEIRRCAGNNNAKFHLTWADKLEAAIKGEG